MRAGGDRNKVIALAQKNLCGAAYFTQAAVDANDPNIRWDNTCKANVARLVGDGYDEFQANANQTSNFEAYVLRYAAQPVDKCNEKAKIVGVKTTTDAAVAAGWQRADQCISEFVSGTKKIEVGAQQFTLFGASDNFIDFARRMVKIPPCPPPPPASGPASHPAVRIIEIDRPVPPSVLTKILALTGNDSVLNAEVIRMWREGVSTLPLNKRNDLAEQEKVADAVVGFLTGVKSSMTDARFRYVIHLMYVDDLTKAGTDYAAHIYQIPAKLVSDVFGKKASLDQLGHLRRLFVQVEDQIKRHPEVDAYLHPEYADPTKAPLTYEERKAFLGDPTRLVKGVVREQIMRHLKQPAKNVKDELHRYDAVGKFTVTQNGTKVTISEIVLIPKVSAEYPLIPEALLEGTRAKDSIIRYGMVVRIWKETIDKAPEAKKPGALQNKLVADLIRQIYPMSDEELLITFVKAVSKARGTVQLDKLPATDQEREETTRLFEQAGTSENWNHTHRFFQGFLDKWKKKFPKVQIDESALWGALLDGVNRVLKNGGTLCDFEAGSIDKDYIIKFVDRKGPGGGDGLPEDDIGRGVKFTLREGSGFEFMPVGPPAGAFLKGVIVPALKWGDWTAFLEFGGAAFADANRVVTDISDIPRLKDDPGKFFRFTNIDLGAKFVFGDGKDGEVSLRAGLIGTRFSWIIDYYNAPEFGLQPATRPSTAYGAKLHIHKKLADSRLKISGDLFMGLPRKLEFTGEDTPPSTKPEEPFTIGAHGALTLNLYGPLFLTGGASVYGGKGKLTATGYGALEYKPMDGDKPKLNTFNVSLYGFYAKADQEEGSLPASLDMWFGGGTVKFLWDIGKNWVLSPFVTLGAGTGGMGRVEYDPGNTSGSDALNFSVGNRVFVFYAGAKISKGPFGAQLFCGHTDAWYCGLGAWVWFGE